MEAQDGITRMLEGLGHEESGVMQRLLPLLYDELRSLARRHLDAERPDHSLNPTALVHEAYFRLAAQDGVQWRNRAHILAVAALAMRRILVDHARGAHRAKRGGAGHGRARVPLDDLLVAPDRRADLLEVDSALDSLAALWPERADIVQMRFFGGLTFEQIAEVTGVSLSTVKREWRFSRAWLYRCLEKGSTPVSVEPSRAL
jgi:RNA polymerase sigma-70 factor, ECF subfamily